jgi:hypothetical protein
MKNILVIILILISTIGISQQSRVDTKGLIVTEYMIYQEDTIDFSLIDDTTLFIQFNPDTVTPYGEGRIFYDSTNKIVGLYNDISDVTLQLGRELWLRAYNPTGGDFPNGSVVYIDSAYQGRPTIHLAKADVDTTVNNVIGVTTHVIGAGEEGEVCTFGLVRGLNTSSLDVRDELFVSASTAGEYTNSRPVYPNYLIKIASVAKVDASDGWIFVNKTGVPDDITINAFNGAFLESFDYRTAVTAGAIKGYIERSGGGDLTMNFSDGFSYLDCTPADTITLTAGTDVVPVTNYVYVPKSTKVLTLSTSSWPTTEHIKVAELVLQSIATTATDSALRNQNWNDHLAGSNGMGHMQHISERIRQLDSDWNTGVLLSSNIVGASSPDDVYVSTTEGKVYQMHLQTFPAMDMSTGDDVHVVNDFTAPYKTVTNLNTELTDADNSSLSGRHFSFVFWGVCNKTGEKSHMMMNLPSGSYNSSVTAISDASNYSVYTIPQQYKGVGFLIARVTYQNSSAGGGTWTASQVQDLRGYAPNRTAGSGSGGTAVSTFLDLTDTPSGYSGEGGNIVQVNSGETAVEFVEHIYGELYDTVKATVNTASGWTDFTGMFEGISNGVTLGGTNGTIQVDDAGHYELSVSGSIKLLTAGDVIDIAIWNMTDSKIVFRVQVSDAFATYMPFSFSKFIEDSSGDEFIVRFDITGGTTVDVPYIHFSAKRLN